MRSWVCWPDNDFQVTSPRSVFMIPFVVSLFASLAAVAAEPSAEELEFFETKVRPLLADHCFQCHSEQSKPLKAGLRLDSRAAAMQGGESGIAILPGKPDESRLIQAVRWQTFEMPPDGKLREDQVALLAKWVEMGAPWPETIESNAPVAVKTYDWHQLQRQHWAWQPIQSPRAPSVQDTKWPKNEVDQFVLARLEESGVVPNPQSESRVLLRRMSLDLIGLPPTVQEIAQFEQQFSENRDIAITELIDRLLASPQYGERWGRHWLDVARFSDGFGGALDGNGLPNAWRYRDWVVNTLNSDLPFEDFLRLQIAGDLIDPKQAVATGFLALGPTYISDGGDPDATAQARSETLDDRVDTVTRGLMALTVSCARCHDHRFDPFPQMDYYSLAGVFNNVENRDFPLASPEIVQAFHTAEKAVHELERKIKEGKERIAAEKRDASTAEQTQFESWEAELIRLRKEVPPRYDVAHVLADAGSADMPLSIRGNSRRPGPTAPRRFLRILGGPETPLFTRGSGRLELAEALISSTNPLTSRVFVNRIWKQHFGDGLVKTSSNFGLLGEKPSHPELLDWLASRFQGKGPGDFHGSMKELHRTIMKSATYQMASTPNEQALGIDADNRLLWRMSPRRLDVETWRDSILSFTGDLSLQVGGPSIEDIGNSSRRTLYAAVSRNGDRFASDTFLRLFDFPVPRATSEGRTSSIVPQQSLFLMNSAFMASCAGKFSARLHREATDDSARIRLAYLLLYCRVATEEELNFGLEFLQDPAPNKVKLSTWEQYAQVLLCASEIMYVE
jgi:mono/diheme cytochrome c family protein